MLDGQVVMCASLTLIHQEAARAIGRGKQSQNVIAHSWVLSRPARRQARA
jgi:hypothetical protein